MNITYRVGNGLYINMTNRCTNDCIFCIRKLCDSVGDAVSLWLDSEPSREEVLNDVLKHDLSEFEEIVFCGFGEPTERLDDLLWICKKIKQVKNIPIRVNTNGHANLIAGYDTTGLFRGLVDKINISLNAADAREYNELSKPVFGIDAYQGMLDFIISYVAVFVFLGLTAYNTQNTKNMLRRANEASQHDAIARISVISALSLYLNFINLFLRILAILGRRR